MNILITGAGGAAAISVWKSLTGQQTIFMADIDPCAAGLYLVPAENRLLIEPGDSDNFIHNLIDLCEKNHIQVLIPTVDVELIPIAKHKHLFEDKGIMVPICPEHTLALCRDKYALLTWCEDTGLMPAFSLLTENSAMPDFPCFAKPREGAGSKGIFTLHNAAELAQLPKDNSYLIEELLPGEEYSVDVYISSKGNALAAVPRLRMKIDSGIAVASQTRIFPELSAMALTIAKKTGIQYIANIQFKANKQQQFKLLEINPRFPGTLPLTKAAGIDIPVLLMKDICHEPLDQNLRTFKELMVVRYWTEQFIPIEAWKTLCR